MDFSVLNLHSKPSFQAWHDLVKKLPTHLQDLHYLPEYSKIYQDCYGYEALLAVYQHKDLTILHPVMKKPINHLKTNQPYYDLATPYGFAGPLCSDPSHPQAKPALAHFYHHWQAYCEAQGWVCEFMAFHPLLDNHQLWTHSPLPKLTAKKEVVIIDLTLSEENLWQQLNRGHKSSIHKANKQGVTAHPVSHTKQHWNQFIKLYHQTMIRNGAANRWLFSKQYFDTSLQLLGKKRSSLFFAYWQQTLVSAYWLIHHGDYIYYHFGGTDEAFFQLRANNLLMWETILWAKKTGYKTLHLGGGVSSDPQDNLLRFKSGFSKTKKTLYTYEQIYLPDIYQELSNVNHAQSGNLEQSTVYFPAYRRS